MSFTKEEIEKKKINANDRIRNWIEEAKTAGVTRLQDRYGEVFQRFEWQKGEHTIEKRHKIVKKGKQDKLSQKKPKTKSESVRGEAVDIPDVLPKTPERGKSRNRSRHTAESRKNRKTPEFRSKSRMTSESRKKDREASSATEYRNNKSSHNRSSRGHVTSLCSVDAISLMCDDESTPDKMSVLRNFYKRRNNSKTVDVLNVDNDWIEETRAKERLLFQNADYKAKTSSIEKRDKAKKTSVLDKNLVMSRQRRLKKLKKEKKENERRKKEEIQDSDPGNQVPTFIVNIDSGRIDAADPMAIRGTLSSFAAPVLLTNEPSTQNVKTHLGAKEDADLLGLRTNSSMTVGSQVQSSISVNRPMSAVRVPSMRMQGLSTGLDIVGMVKRQRSERRLAAKKSQMASQMTKKEAPKEVKKIEPSSKTQEKLRKYIRKIMNVLTLLRVTQRKVKGDMIAERRVRKKRKPPVGKEHLTFDPNYYKAATTTYGGLSVSARTALWKQPGHRTEEDVHILMEVMLRLPFFTKYSRTVKEELARVMWYDEFENGRIIIRQGDIGSRMYFVVSGGAAVQRTEIDPRTITYQVYCSKLGQIFCPTAEQKNDSKIVQHLHDLNPGATFGELALLRNITRTYSVVCKGESEFLSLSKDEFNSVLRKDYEEFWNCRFDFFNASKHIKRLNEEQIKQFADMSEIRSYGHNKLILGDITGLTQWVYFVRTGKCELVKKVEMIRSQSPYLRPNLYLPEMNEIDSETFMNKPYGRKMRKCQTETHFLTVLTLHPGDYFGIGENLKDMFVVAKGKVECILLNAIIFGLNWQENERLKKEREKSIPSNRELYRRFEQNRRWLEYRKKLVDIAVFKHNKRPHRTLYRDVPEPLVLQPSIPFDLIHHEHTH